MSRATSLMLIGIMAGLLGATLMIVSREATLDMFSLNGTSFSLGFLCGLAMLLISPVMLRSAVFPRLTALSGVAAGVTALIPASMATLGFLLSVVSLLPLIVWLFLVGRRLFQLASIP